MKIRRVWFGFSVIFIVFTCLVLGYGVYESILNSSEYIRIYEKEVKVEDNKFVSSEVANLNDMNIRVSDFEVYTRTEDDFMPMQVYVDNDGNETVTKYSRQVKIAIELNKGDNILLEPRFDYILYDENNVPLVGNVSGDIKKSMKEMEKFYIEKFGKENYKEAQKKYGTLFIGTQGWEGKNDDPTRIEKIIDFDLEDGTELTSKLYLRIFNVNCYFENGENFLTNEKDIVEFIIERK